MICQTSSKLEHKGENMADYIDGILARQKQLADDQVFCTRNRVLSDFDGWTLQRFLTLEAFVSSMPKETQEAIRVAKQIAETKGMPADRSATAAEAALIVSTKALAVNERTAKNAIKQRWVTTFGVVIALIALMVAAFKPEKKAELSEAQLKRLRAEVVRELQADVSSVDKPLVQPTQHMSSQNPFLPKRK